MAGSKRLAGLLVIISITLAACGGEEEAPAESAAATPPAATESQTGSEVEPALQPMKREVFAYQGSGRDPFLSLMQTGDVRPLLQDLRVTTVTYDTRNPRNSVAILRDTVENKAYPVHVGDELGRMRIVSIRPGEVEVVVQEFGADRRIILRQRRRQGS